MKEMNDTISHEVCGHTSLLEWDSVKGSKIGVYTHFTIFTDFYGKLYDLVKIVCHRKSHDL